MKTYWNIFIYVYLIPCILFIILWILSIKYLDKINSDIWPLLVIFMITLIYFLIYRYIKAIFAIYWANYKEEFNIKNFKKTVSLSDTKWWITFWNLLLISIIVWISIWVIESIIWTILFWASWWFPVLIEIFSKSISTNNPDLIKEWIEKHLEDSSILLSISQNIISTFLYSIWTVFIIVFTYVFYIRLEREKEYIESKEINL